MLFGAFQFFENIFKALNFLFDFLYVKEDFSINLCKVLFYGKKIFKKKR